MDALHWKRVGELFAAARQLDVECRQKYLAEQCGDDQDLFHEVQSLLDADAESGPLDSTPTVSNLPVPEIIAGRFRIVRYIAEGGMGTVYEAHDLQLEERVALKTIRHDIASDPSVVQRFKREITLGKSVTHPNVCRIHDLVLDRSHTGAEALFLSMQFLEGETLASRIARGPIPKEEAIPLIRDMADGLSAAHQVNVIHRDFKSGNVMLVTRGDRKCAVVTDFGLARAIGGGAPMTRSGLVGTVDYMAPEQIRGEELTPATDIYALGVVMYEMATGQRPFTGDSKVTVALKHLNDEPQPPRQLVPNLGPLWSETILKCLRKAPQRRFQSASEVKTALVGDTSSWHSPVLRKLSNTPVSRWLTASLVLTLGVGISVLSLVKGWPKHEATIDQSVAVLPFQQSGDTPEYYSFGFTEEVMNSLGQVPGLHLIGPESSYRYRASNLSATEIGRKLNARYLLLGSVHHLGNQVHVIVRMVDAKDGSQVWSRDISRGEQDVLVLPDDIARTLSQHLNISLASAQLKGQPIDSGGLTARNLYWTGRFYFHQRTDQAVQGALEYFRQAVKNDPQFAEAYCGIADALFVLAERNLVSPEKALVEARQAAHRAVDLDRRLPAAYVSLAQVTSVYDRNLNEAERLFRHALRLDPRLAPAWQWLSYQLAKERRFSEAIQAAEAAVTADPLSTAANINLAVVYFYAGLDDGAMQQSRKLEQMESKLFVDHLIIAEVFARRGLISEAIHEMDSVPEEHQDHPMTLRVWVEVYAQAGMKDRAQQTLSRLLARAEKGGVPPSYVAAAYAAYGEKDNAFAWLQRACDERDPFASVANAYPAFDSIRSDPRWAPLMARLGFKTQMTTGSSDLVIQDPATSQVSKGLHRVDPALGVVAEVGDPGPKLAPRESATLDVLSLPVRPPAQAVRHVPAA